MWLADWFYKGHRRKLLQGDGGAVRDSASYSFGLHLTFFGGVSLYPGPHYLRWLSAHLLFVETPI